MTTLPCLDDIAIRASDQRLMLPAYLEKSEIDSVIEHKAAILADLRGRQMTPAGFLTCLPGALLDEIRAVPWLVFDIETSTLTRYSTPERVTKTKAIGHGTWMTYLAELQDATLDVRPRLRVLTIHHDLLGTYAWDLDALSPQPRRQLFDAVIRNKVVIAHNAGFDLSWMFGETEARPRFVLDSMLLVRQIRPGVLLRLFGKVVTGDEVQQELAVKMIESKQGKASATLAYTAACLGMPVPDKSYQAAQNWCITPLSCEHHGYAAGDVDLPLAILRFLIPDAGVEEMPAIIEHKYPWYLPYAAATVRLAESHVRGVPFDFEAAGKLKAAYLVELEQAAAALLLIPEYAALPRETLVDPESGETQALKLALAAHAALHGVELPKTDKGGLSTDRKALMLCGADKLPAWIPYDTLKAAKKAIGTIEEYKRAASLDGRLHSIISCSTNTGRMASSEPNLQNVPRDPRFRELVRGEPDNFILAVDYSAAELRIAAVLAERAIADIRARIERGDMATWFMREVMNGYYATSRLVCPPEPEPSWTLEWLEDAIRAVAQTVLRRSEQTMMSIFRRDLDPHLVCAIDMLRRAGKIDTGGLSSIEWLALQSVEAREELAEIWKEWRQKAKVVNFGLLYGMSAIGLHRRGITEYGLTWTLEEARQVHDTWFEIFPELRLWHFWSKYIPSRKVNRGAMAMWDPYQGKLKQPEYEQRVFTPTTLTGRPFAIFGGFREARNYQDQGSGSDLLVEAIAMLPEDVASMWILAVHDELVFSVPKDAIDEVTRTVMETMVAAGDKVLQGIIPVKVEPQVGETWRKKKKKFPTPILQAEAA